MPRIAYIQNMEEWSDSFRFSHKVTVRFSETDMFGHLNNTVPFTYFEEARIEYLKAVGFMADWLNPERESIPVVADLQCDFLAQIYFGEELLIHVKVHTVGNSSVDIHYKGTRMDGTLVLTGRGAMVQISRHNGKAIPWTEQHKKKLLTEKVQTA
ncbi:acyl-CoA thioester hydrolase [Peribacillus deserti]|uniref:Acyl-CoA thioester hydrolase n=1 Tax=Peribacillus deserti TaxID=673318 RepID=A0ABS2QHJ6_9BACI|nr:thioesterase family protein [Peribacillus deserti]MBM7691988.1 acyl-CoA thioester hydrolase [Peribacillus deserti]